MPSSRQVLIFENSFNLTNFLVKEFFKIAEDAVKSRGKFVIALSAGKSPIEFYIRLATLKDFTLWRKTHIFFADERFVPNEHPDSNFRQIKENLLSDIAIPIENIHLFNTSCLSIKQSQHLYQEELKEFFKLSSGEIPSFDFTLLGIGEDGHTASLFPNQKESTDLEHLVVTTTDKKNSHQRLSLSLSVLNHSRTIYSLALGEKKANIMKEILVDKKIFPASLVLSTMGKTHILLDKTAAKNISYKDNYTHLDKAISI